MSDHNEFTQSAPNAPVLGVFRRDDLDFFDDISGPRPTGGPKARVLLNYYELCSDGTTHDLQTLTVEKPIVNVYTDSDYAVVDLDFGNGRDQDLAFFYNTLQDSLRPQNSIRFLPEEWERGYFETPYGPQMVFKKVWELALSPINKEESYMIFAYKPIFFGLTPNRPAGEACVIRIVFEDAALSVVKDLHVDRQQIHNDILAELQAEDRRAFQ